LSFKIVGLPDEYEIAPDGSLVRLIHSDSERSLVHCTLPEKCVSKAIRHRTVSEVWYFIAGEGELWRRLEDQEETVRVGLDASITIPVGTSFQFRNTGTGPLKFLCFTMPRWPGSDEAEHVEGPWLPSLPD